MGVDLERRDQSLHCTWQGWHFLLKTAYDYGWEPAGTVLPDFDNWENTYFTNQGQTVTGADAVALGEALERYLLKPSFDFGWESEGKEMAAVEEFSFVYFEARDRPWRVSKEMVRAAQAHYVREVPERVDYGERAFVEKFVTFFKGGAFSIW